MEEAGGRARCNEDVGLERICWRRIVEPGIAGQSRFGEKLYTNVVSEDQLPVYICNIIEVFGALSGIILALRDEHSVRRRQYPCINESIPKDVVRPMESTTLALLAIKSAFPIHVFMEALIFPVS